MGSGLPENANHRSQGADAIIARLERELESTREELKRANAALDAIVTMDGDERIVDFSPAAERVFGFTQEEVKGQLLSETINPRNPREYGEAHVAGLAQNLKSGIANALGGQVELAALRKEGTILPVEHSLVEARELAEAANESKSAFLANMSHEIRTPMTAILGYTDLLADRVQGPEAAAYLRTIRRNGYFLLDIINDILDLSKIEGGMLEIACERFTPNQLVEDVRAIMEVRAVEKKLTLEVEYVGLIPKLIESDATRLKQILINLVGNAIKFTKKGGVKVVVSYCDQSLQFDIIDTGIGMNHRQLERLFQPFSQADQTVNREFGGTGLGLAISQRLATMLGGNIGVTSELNKGSKFTVTIATGNITDVQFVKPLLSIEPKVEAPIPVTIHLNCEILVVDDRRDIRFLSRRFLTEVGAHVTEAEDGQVAIQTVMQSVSEGKTFDLILLDMQMPRLDGYETAKQLRRLGFTGPIIALTADAMHGDMSRCIASGCNDYLSKPIDKNVMLNLVSDYLSRLPQNAKNET